MPLVRIDLMEGRSPEVIRELHERVAALVAEISGSPLERVRTYITEFSPQSWGVGGVPADIARGPVASVASAAPDAADASGAADTADASSSAG